MTNFKLGDEVQILGDKGLPIYQGHIAVERSLLGFYDVNVPVLGTYRVHEDSIILVPMRITVRPGTLEYDMRSIKQLDCECGAHKVGSNAHSSWCQLNAII